MSPPPEGPSPAPTACPICRTPVPPSEPVCASCGLPRDLWPTEVDPQGAEPGGGFESVFREIMAETKPGEVPELNSILLVSHPPGEPGGETEARVSAIPGEQAPPTPDRSIPDLEDYVERRIRLGRRAGLDLGRFPAALEAARKHRSEGRDEEARRALLEAAPKLQTYLETRFRQMYSDLRERGESLLRISPDEALRSSLADLAEAFRGDDLERMQRELRRAQGEVERREEEAGPWISELRKLDIVLTAVQRLGGDVSGPRHLRDEAFLAAARGDVDRARALLNESAVLLLDLLPGLLAQEMVRLGSVLRRLGASGANVRGPALTLKRMIQLLRERNYYRAAFLLQPLEETVSSLSRAS
jgi:hypothetical protein